MYIKTPKRYRSNKRGIISFKRVLFWLFVPLFIFVFVGIYMNIEQFQPSVNKVLDNFFEEANQQIATRTAPDPTATPDPTNAIVAADDAWFRGAIEEAVDVYEDVSKSVPNNARIHYSIALGRIMGGDYTGALTAAETTITAKPFSPEGWSIRAMALNRLERYGESIASALHAITLIENMPENTPNKNVSHARALAFLAESYLDSGQIERAMNTVTEAIELDPERFEAYQVRGKIYQTGYYDNVSAYNDFAFAHELAPNMIYITIWLARIEDDFENRVELLQNIVDLNPNNTLALYDLAAYYFRVEGNYNEAAAKLTACINSDPDNGLCHYLLGRAKLSLDDTIGAQEALLYAYNLEPENGYRIYWLAQSYIRLGQCGQALPYLESGYQISLQDGDSALQEAFESVQECGANFVTPESNTES